MCGGIDRAMTTIIVTFIAVLIALIALRQLQLRFFYPRPTSLPANVEDDIGAVLRRFEAALAEHAPEVLASLQVGLADDEIRKVESDHRLGLTEEMRALYRWRNGSPPASNVELIPGHSFVPLDYAVRTRDEIRRQSLAAPLVQRIAYFVFAGHRTNWLPVLDDLCGDGYFYDSARRCGGGAFFYHFAEDRQYRFFPSLINFLAGASECYETGIYRAGRRGSAGENYERSFQLWRRYASF